MFFEGGETLSHIFNPLQDCSEYIKKIFNLFVIKRVTPLMVEFFLCVYVKSDGVRQEVKPLWQGHLCWFMDLMAHKQLENL